MMVPAVLTQLVCRMKTPGLCLSTTDYGLHTIDYQLSDSLFPFSPFLFVPSLSSGIYPYNIQQVVAVTIADRQNLLGNFYFFFCNAVYVIE